MTARSHTRNYTTLTDAIPWLARLRRHTPMKLGWVYVHRLHFRWSPQDVSARQKRILLAAQFMPKIA